MSFRKCLKRRERASPKKGKADGAGLLRLDLGAEKGKGWAQIAWRKWGKKIEYQFQSKKKG